MSQLLSGKQKGRFGAPPEASVQRNPWSYVPIIVLLPVTIILVVITAVPWTTYYNCRDTDELRQPAVRGSERLRPVETGTMSGIVLVHRAAPGLAFVITHPRRRADEGVAGLGLLGARRRRVRVRDRGDAHAQRQPADPVRRARPGPAASAGGRLARLRKRLAHPGSCLAQCRACTPLMPDLPARRCPAGRRSRPDRRSAGQPWTGPRLPDRLRGGGARAPDVPGPADRGHPVVVVPTLERPAALASPLGPAEVEIRHWGETDDPYALVGEPAAGRTSAGSGWTTTCGPRRCSRSATRCRPSEQVLAGDVLRELRMRKTRDEVDALRAAGQAIDRVHARMGEFLRVGRTERAGRRGLIRAAIVEEGHATAEFAIVAAGPNGASPHHDASDRVIADGDVVVVDIGGTMPSGYCSDSTRTYAMGSSPMRFREAVRHPACRSGRRLRGGPAGRAVQRDRQGCARRDHRRRVRRVLHPPDRARHRSRGPRGSVHRRLGTIFRSSPEWRSRSSRGSTCRIAWAPASRTSSCARRPVASGSNLQPRELVVLGSAS